MATERQMAANQRNAARSTGPRSTAGKARSRANATKHGLAGATPDRSPEFLDRRAKWAADHQPQGQAAEWALDRAVAASLRIERCEREVDKLCVVDRERARLAWDEDHALEAAKLAEQLATRPVVVSRELRTTLAGVLLLIDCWLALVDRLDHGDWSEDEASQALDLFGIAPEARSGSTLIDAPDGTDPISFRRDLALDEVERLETLHDEAMVPLDELEQVHAMSGDAALHSHRARLILRYEREAWRHYHRAMKDLKTSAEPEPRPSFPILTPPPRPIAPTPPPAARVTPSKPTFEEERRALLAECAPIRQAVTEELIGMGLDEEDAWIDALERRIDAQMNFMSPTPERSQSNSVEARPRGVIVS